MSIDPVQKFIGTVADFTAQKTAIQNPFKRGRILIINHGGNYYGLSNVCPHQGGPLSVGSIIDIEDTEKTIIQCPIHSWEFNISTGQCLSNKYVLDTYGIEVIGDSLYISAVANANIEGTRRDFNGNEMVKSAFGWI